MTGRDTHPVEHYLAVALPLRMTSTAALMASGLVVLLLSIPSVRDGARRCLIADRDEGRYWRPVALGVILVASALRMPGLGSTSLWLDEAIISMVSVEGFTGMLGRMGRDSSAAPVHHAVQAILFAVAPQSAAIARLPALIAGMATVGLLLATPRWGIPRGAALAAALGVALSPAHVGFARDATQYAPAVAMSAILIVVALDAFVSARDARHSRADLWGLSVTVVVTPWVAYPSVFVALALLTGLFLGSLLLSGSAALRLRRSAGLAALGLIVSSAAVYAVIARRQFGVLENWYLAANYPSTSGVSPRLWVVRSLDGYFAILGGGQVTGRWSASSIEGFRNPILEGSALGWVAFVVLVIGFWSAVLGELRTAHVDQRRAPDVSVLVMGTAILLALGSMMAAVLELYPFGGIHQQLHATPVLLLGVGCAAVHLLRGRFMSARVAAAAAVLTLFAVPAAAALPTVYEEREDIVSAVVVGIDGRSGRGLEPVADHDVWIYRAARPAVRFHFPDRSFRELRSGPADGEGMLAELDAAAHDGRIAVVFSQIYPHPVMGDQRRALQEELSVTGWVVEEEIHHPNTVVIVLRAPRS